MTTTKKKIIVTCALMIVTVMSFFYSTLAFFTDSASANFGGIATGKASVEIVDITYPFGSSTAVPPNMAVRIMPGYEISKTVTARNAGGLPLYVRVQIASVITLAEHAQGREEEIDLSLVSFNINEEFWMEHEGYYYYRTSLAQGTEAVPLCTKVIFSEEMGNLYKDSTIVVTTRMEIVQANNNGETPITAIGWREIPARGGVTE